MSLPWAPHTIFLPPWSVTNVRYLWWRRRQLTSSTPMLTSPSRRPGSRPSATTRSHTRPTLSQSTRDNRLMVVLSVLVARNAIRSSKSRLNPERCRANGTCSTRTPWAGQASRRSPARTRTFHRPISVCRQRENTGRVS